MPESAVGNHSGTTINWVNDIDIGATHGIKNAAEIEAVGGDAGRAAVGFLGTDRPGDYQALHFPGKWYAFIATTYMWRKLDDGECHTQRSRAKHGGYLAARWQQNPAKPARFQQKSLSMTKAACSTAIAMVALLPAVLREQRRTIS